MEDDVSVDVLLKEDRIFTPPEELIEKSNVKKWMDKYNIHTYDELLVKAKEIEWFWGEVSKDVVEWFKPYDKVLEWDLPWVKWYVGAKYNIVHDALDKHVTNWRKNKIAYIFEGEPGDTRKLS